MRPVVRVGACLLAGLSALAPRVYAASLDDLAWLAGCWAGQGVEPGSEEHWLVPAGGSMLGVSRTVRRGKTTDYEFMQIRETDPGKLVFISHPSGQPEDSFPMVRLTETEVVFENLAHDFPQRIIYRHDKNALRARVEGTDNGRTRGIDFPMNRIPCADATGQPRN